jgi:tetratricopeptide (TPR) repeat protein
LTRVLAIFVLLLAALPEIYSQPTLSFDLKKPKKYENRKLGSEKTEEKKFGIVRRFTQNGITKFNYHFNANKKLEEVIARAKAHHKDDYTKLLSFYNYSLDVTSKDKVELDSVIYKANAGILIHDLRNSWIDNLYMLMGEAYYFKKELDSAYLSFQYINYAFSPKEKDGYDKPIGSNANADQGGNAFSISTKENSSIPKKVWSRPPSRNESFIWQIRTFLARDETPEAAGLIETLKHDPFFPERLKTDLREMQALWFYKQQMYDSSAFYLEQALDNAENREEKARWEYLIGQMYEKAGKTELAGEFFDRTVSRTLNPVLEVYARLNSIRQHKGDEKVIQENINELSKMARKDKYLAYRDIIYYAAAEMELERNNVPGAKAFLIKATAVQGDDNTVRTKAFLLLADLSFKEKNYSDAKRFYDSITNVNPDLADPEALKKLRSALAKIVAYQTTINREDSLQRVAAMPDAEREAYIKKLVKQLRKQQGLKEEENASGTGGGPLDFNNDSGPTDLFGSNAKGDWYFYNNTLKAKGYTDFKGKFGNRPNVDNWQRLAALKQALPVMGLAGDANGKNGADAAAAGPISYESLLKQVPLTPSQLKVSNDSIEMAQFGLGKAYLEGLEDYPMTIGTLEDFLTKFPDSKKRPEALFMLAYCYSKTGDVAKAKAVQDELKQKYAGTSYEKIVSNPTGISADSTAKLDMTRRYDNIYNLFIEGSFDQALEQKKIADSLYSNNYWTPQLLYIQSVYYIQQREDSTAKKSLQDIIRLYPNSPLAGKARTLIDVLGRRQQIEDYLTKLQIERPAEDTTGMAEPTGIVAPPPVVYQQQPRDTSAVVAKPTQQSPPPVVAKKDSVQTNVSKPQPQQPPVANKPADVAKTDKPVTPPVQKQPAQLPPPPAVKKDSAQPKVTPAAPPKPLVLTNIIENPHYVIILLNKVDPVYVNEARNAFNRYNREQYSAKGYSVNNQVVSDDVKLVMIGTFPNANAAIEYIDKTRKLAVSEIIPWLPANKYSFGIITDNNLEVLKNTKDVETFKKFLSQAFPGKF